MERISPEATSCAKLFCKLLDHFEVLSTFQSPTTCDHYSCTSKVRALSVLRCMLYISRLTNRIYNIIVNNYEVCFLSQIKQICKNYPQKQSNSMEVFAITIKWTISLIIRQRLATKLLDKDKQTFKKG